MATYRLDDNAFMIEEYARSRPFASFLPGIAGVWGIPMWVFYVNRGQAIAGFGISDKDHPIMEFLPANKAYRATSLQGFRTFLKVKRGGHETFHEPFRCCETPSRQVAQRMRISMHELQLEELHKPLGLGH